MTPLTPNNDSQMNTSSPRIIPTNNIDEMTNLHQQYTKLIGQNRE
jgi:hypothetical protein